MIIWNSFKLQNTNVTINFTATTSGSPARPLLKINAPVEIPVLTIGALKGLEGDIRDIKLSNDLILHGRSLKSPNADAGLWVGDGASLWGTLKINESHSNTYTSFYGPVNFYQPTSFDAAVTLNNTATFNGTASFANDVTFTEPVNLPRGSTIDNGEPWADVPHLLPREQSAYILILGNKKDNDATLIPAGFPVGMREIYCQIHSYINGSRIKRILKITRPTSSEERLRYQFDGVYNKQSNDGPLARFLNMAYNLDWIYRGDTGDATIQIFEHYDNNTYTCSDALTDEVYINYSKKDHYVVTAVPVPLLESEELPSHINGQIIYEKPDDKLWVQLLPLYYIEECIENWYWWWGYAYTNEYYYMYAPMAYTNYNRMYNNTDSTLSYKLMPRFIQLTGNYSPGKTGYDDGPLYLEPLGPILFWH